MEFKMFNQATAFADQLRKIYGTALLSKDQTAKELSVSRATIDRMRNSGEIKSQLIGKQVRFNVKEVARLVERGN